MILEVLPHINLKQKQKDIYLNNIIKNLMKVNQSVIVKSIQKAGRMIQKKSEARMKYGTRDEEKMCGTIHLQICKKTVRTALIISFACTFSLHTWKGREESQILIWGSDSKYIVLGTELVILKNEMGINGPESFDMERKDSIVKKWWHTWSIIRIN